MGIPSWRSQLLPGWHKNPSQGSTGAKVGIETHMKNLFKISSQQNKPISRGWISRNIFITPRQT
jgi:hypothetical protein